VSLAVTKEITHANHHERQFMQYLQVGGWQKASALPDSPRVIEKLLARSWIERKPCSADRVLYRITEKAPLPRRLGSRNLRCPLRLDADRASVCKTKMSVANVEAIR